MTVMMPKQQVTQVDSVALGTPFLRPQSPRHRQDTAAARWVRLLLASIGFTLIPRAHAPVVYLVLPRDSLRSRGLLSGSSAVLYRLRVRTARTRAAMKRCCFSGTLVAGGEFPARVTAFAWLEADAASTIEDQTSVPTPVTLLAEDRPRSAST